VCIIGSLCGCVRSKSTIKHAEYEIAYNKLFDVRRMAFIKAFGKIGINTFAIAKNIPAGHVDNIDSFCDNNRVLIVRMLGYPQDIRDDLFQNLKEEVKKNFKLLYKLECLDEK